MGRVLKEQQTIKRTGVVSEPKTPRHEPVPLASNEARKHQRYYFRALATATIHPPAGETDARPQVCFIMTRDLSRSGISVMHPVPLFQSQRIDLEFADGRKLAVEIQWIRKLETNLYMMGCQFVQPSGGSKSV